MSNALVRAVEVLRAGHRPVAMHYLCRLELCSEADAAMVRLIIARELDTFIHSTLSLAFTYKSHNRLCSTFVQ